VPARGRSRVQLRAAFFASLLLHLLLLGLSFGGDGDRPDARKSAMTTAHQS